jgi:superfamily II DNA helicase RecQ
MNYQFFVIPAHNPVSAQEKLNRFCAGHRVANVEKAFVANGDRSFWSVCVTWLDGAGEKGSRPKSRVDYKEVLNEKDFAIFVKLRTLRKTIAEKEGLPVYALFSNEQLAAMVQKRIITRTALGAIDGVGKARLEKYGEAFISVLRSEFAASSSITRRVREIETRAN